MTVIDMLPNNHIVAIVYDNLRRNRTGADKHCPDRRT
jgi:hypothetical protein